jgi:hypothetical protein
VTLSTQPPAAAPTGRHGDGDGRGSWKRQGLSGRQAMAYLGADIHSPEAVVDLGRSNSIRCFSQRTRDRRSECRHPSVTGMPSTSVGVVTDRWHESTARQCRENFSRSSTHRHDCRRNVGPVGRRAGAGEVPAAGRGGAEMWIYTRNGRPRGASAPRPPRPQVAQGVPTIHRAATTP